MKLSAPTPILRFFDEARAREFYSGFLGFEIDWEHRFAADLPLYMQVSRDACVLHLSEHHGDACPGAALRVEMAGVRDFHAELVSRDYKYYKPQVTQADWGALELEVLDPSRNRLVFFERKP